MVCSMLLDSSQLAHPPLSSFSLKKGTSDKMNMDEDSTGG